MEGRFKEILGFDIKKYGWKALQGDSYSILPQSRTLIMSADYDDHRKDFYSTTNYAKMVYFNTLVENADTGIKELFAAMYSRVKWDFDIVDGHIVVKKGYQYKDLDIIKVEKDSTIYKFTNIGYTLEAYEIYARSKFFTKSEIEYVAMPGRNDVAINDVGILIIPQNSFSKNKIIEVYLHSDGPRQKEIEICSVQYSQKEDEIIKECLYRRVSIEDNKLFIERKEATHRAWMNHIHTSLDFVKNPLNKDAWDILKDEPAYQGADLFVTSDERPYIHINGAWIPASREWIRKHPNLPETIAYEYQLYKGVRGSL